MKVLIVALKFPPKNAISAVRLGAVARLLEERGHDVRVITTDMGRTPDKGPTPGTTMPNPLDEWKVIRTQWVNLDRIVERVRAGGRQRDHASPRDGDPRPDSGAATEPRARGLARAVVGWAKTAYKSAVRFPDRYVGWLPYAVRAGVRLTKGWKPDVIYASALPVTPLLVGYALHRWTGAPWVAEFRDPWHDNVYKDPSGLRRAVEERLETVLMRSALGVVTVTPPWADQMRARYGLPTEVVMNGCDDRHPAPVEAKKAPGPLRVVYTGSLYGGRRDPTHLFRAMARLEPGAVQALFYTGDAAFVMREARRCGVADAVEVPQKVGYKECLRVQREADVLLLLLDEDEGWLPAKLFEYVTARRPVLCIGSAGNVAYQIVAGHGLGRAAEDEAGVADALAEWLNQAASAGRPHDIPDGAAEVFSRDRQVAVLEGFLLDLLGGGGRRGPSAVPSPGGVERLAAIASTDAAHRTVGR